MLRLPLSISPTLAVRIGDAATQLTPRQGLAIAEDLTRKSFRRVMAEEAERHGVPLDAPSSRPLAKRSAAA